MTDYRALKPYVGIPYRDRGRDRTGVDCWGLVHLFYAEILRLRLPDYLGLYTRADDKAQVALAVTIGRDAWERREDSEPVFGDVILFRIGGYPCHVGIALGELRFLHCLKGRNSTIEELNALSWLRRFEGSYRWAR